MEPINPYPGQRQDRREVFLRREKTGASVASSIKSLWIDLPLH